MRGTDWVTGVQVQRETMRLFRKWYFILFEVLLLTFGMIRAQVFYGVFLRVFSQSQCQNAYSFQPRMHPTKLFRNIFLHALEDPAVVHLLVNFASGEGAKVGAEGRLVKQTCRTSAMVRQVS